VSLKKLGKIYCCGFWFIHFKVFNWRKKPQTSSWEGESSCWVLRKITKGSKEDLEDLISDEFRLPRQKVDSFFVDKDLGIDAESASLLLDYDKEVTELLSNLTTVMTTFSYWKMWYLSKPSMAKPKAMSSIMSKLS